jgi:hypothetical protein
MFIVVGIFAPLVVSHKGDDERGAAYDKAGSPNDGKLQERSG